VGAAQTWMRASSLIERCAGWETHRCPERMATLPPWSTSRKGISVPVPPKKHSKSPRCSNQIPPDSVPHSGIADSADLGFVASAEFRIEQGHACGARRCVIRGARRRIRSWQASGGALRTAPYRLKRYFSSIARSASQSAGERTQADLGNAGTDVARQLVEPSLVS
jgi:hypothetical protein